MIGEPEMFVRIVAPARAASWLGGTGTHMSSQTSTWSAKPGTSVGPEEQVGSERDPVARDVDGLAALVVAGREVPPLVELAVVGQVGLRRDAENAPPWMTTPQL